MATEQELKDIVKEQYTAIAEQDKETNMSSCCGAGGCSTEVYNIMSDDYTKMDGYNADADLGLGCGLPTEFAQIKEGDTVIDLGSGAGFDCFLASRETGDTGKVIGVDITPEMVAQAKKNAEKGKYKNVEFKIGEIENLPIETNSIDLIISNCVINLSNQKEQIFKESFRVLKPNGRIMISDIILLNDLPKYVKNSFEGHIACLAGAVRKEDYINAISKAGFTEINIDKQTHFPIELMLNDPIAIKIIEENNLSKQEIENIANSVASISISAKRL